MQNAAGFGDVGGEGGEEEGGVGVGVDHAAFPSVGEPAAHFPRQAGQAVGVMVVGVAAAVYDVQLDGLGGVVANEVDGEGERYAVVEAFLDDGAEGGGEGKHAGALDDVLYHGPVDVGMMGAAGEVEVGDVAQGDAPGGEVCGHMAQEVDHFEVGRGGHLLE